MMNKRKLGSSPVEVSPIAFGAWAIGGWMWGGAEAKDAIEAVQAAVDLNITTIDTAPVYGFGRSEELIAEALKDIPRDRYELLTKFGLNWEDDKGEFFFDSFSNSGAPVKIYKYAAKEKVIAECENSLKRLKTDYLDLLQIHWPDATTPVSETMEALSILQDQGKIRAGAVCNYSASLAKEALKFYPIASNQVPFSMIHRDIENEIIPQAIESGIGILAYSPLQRGLLTGKIKPGHVFNDGDTRAGHRYYTAANIEKSLQLLEELKPFAEKYHVNYAQLVLNWTMEQKGITCVLAGARNAEQMKENAGALGFSLSKDDLDQMNSIVRKYHFQ
jgi:aryl-alcohol dehydrogenase-like predicted oxidoreductase